MWRARAAAVLRRCRLVRRAAGRAALGMAAQVEKMKAEHEDALAFAEEQARVYICLSVQLPI